MACCEEPEERQQSKMGLDSVSFSASMKRMSIYGGLTKEKLSSVTKMKTDDGPSEIKNLKKTNRKSMKAYVFRKSKSDHGCSISLATASTSTSHPSSFSKDHFDNQKNYIPDENASNTMEKTLHGVPPIVVNKNSVLKEKKRLENIERIKLLQKNIDSWKEDYRKAVDDAGVKAEEKYKGHIEEMARENERIRAQINKAHRYAAVIEKETDARSKESEKTIMALKYADEAHTKENDNIRKEVSTLKREADKPHLSAEDIMDMVAEKERAVSESKRLNKRMDFLVYFIECLKEQIARDVQLLEKEKQLNKSPSSVDETIKAQEEYETTVKRLQENASRAREELQTCREECDCALEEVDILRWKIRDRQSTLAQLNSQQQQPQPQPGVFERWFGF